MAGTPDDEGWPGPVGLRSAEGGGKVFPPSSYRFNILN
jgi:hypothetical protein